MSEFQIISRLGGRKAVYEEIRADLRLTTLRAMGMWVRRKSLPGEAIVKLMALADARGLSYGPDDFRVIETKPAPPERKAAA